MSRTKPKPRAKANREPVARTPTDWDLIERMLESPLVRTAFLFGPPGVGKTYASYHFGRDPESVFAVTVTEDTPAAELRGHYVPVENRMEWRDGPFTAAMRAGARLVVNEVSHAPPEVQSLLYPVLESQETAMLTLPTNEMVRPAPGFQVVCTDNFTPDELPEALQDRFDVTFEISEVHPNALGRLPSDLRRAAESCFGLEPDRQVLPRRWAAIAKLREEFGLRSALRAVLGHERGEQIFDALQLGEA